MKTLLPLAVLALCLSACRSADVPPLDPAESPAAARGRLAAERDIRDGSLILRTYGIASSGSRYSQLLRDRLGVRTQVAAECLVDPEKMAETLAYNAIMEAEIERRFGARLLEELRREATRESASNTNR